MQNVYSNEYYMAPDAYRQVLSDISFCAERGQIWSVMGSSIFEIKLLLEIMANARSFQKGSYNCAGIETIYQKRRILPYLFYIASTNMAFEKMNVLEYLMFITSKSQKNAVIRQEIILNCLLDTRLDYICLTPISKLTPEEKSVVELIAATLSDNFIIIMNLPRLNYSQELIHSFALISDLIKMNNKTLVLSTQDTILAQSVSSHIMYIYKGINIYSNTLEKLISKYDKVLCSIGIENAEFAKRMLELELPCYGYRVSQNILDILVSGDYIIAFSRVFSALSKYNLSPYFIKKNKKNLSNALKELILYSDLQ